MLGYIHFPSWISPEIVPGLPVRWYSLMYLIAFGISYILFRYQVKKRELKIDDDTIINLFFFGIIGLILGARIFAALIYDTTGQYWENPLLIFWPFNEQCQLVGLSGMSYHGGLIGGVLGVIIYTRIKKLDTLDVGDMLMAGIPLGYTFGRLGNFINGELYGRVTTVPWGMVFPGAQRFDTSQEWVQDVMNTIGMSVAEAGQYVNLPRHPSQLYEAFIEGILLWLVLWFVFKNRKPFKGFIISLYIIGYGLGRFIIEYFRQPDANIGYPIAFGDPDAPIYLFDSLLNISTGQILCFLMIAGGLLCMAVFSKIGKFNDSDEENTLDAIEEKKKKTKKIRKKLE